jgi:CheY-like chemotaxis protein
MSHRLNYGNEGLAAAVSQPQTARKVLVVEDCAAVAEGWASLLKEWGHEPCIARNGPEALAAARKQHPEVVLLDAGLPGMDGYEVARRLRAQLGLTDILLVMLTGNGSDEDRCRSNQAGCDLHLVKPVDPEEVQRLLAMERILIDVRKRIPSQ